MKEAIASFFYIFTKKDTVFRAIVLVGLGGAGGSILRYLIALIVNKNYTAGFPLATFLINIAGCFAIGLLTGWLDRVQPEGQALRLLLVTGFCGGFTTFSTFANENLLLLKGSSFFVALVYTAASLALGLLAVWCGHLLSR